MDTIGFGFDLGEPVFSATSSAMSMLATESQGLAFNFLATDLYPSTGFYGGAAIKDTTTPANNYDSSPDKTASSLLTYTSPSVKMTMGPSGTLRRYGAHNLFTYSEDQSNAAWAGLIAGVTSRTAGQTGPTGTANATRLVTTAGWYMGQSIAFIAGATYAISVWVKSNTGDDQGFVLFADGGGVNSTEQTATTTWQLFTFTFTAPNTATTQAGIRDGSGLASTDLLVGLFHIRRTPSDSTYLSTGASARYALPLEWSSAGVLQGLLVEEARTNSIYPSIPPASGTSGLWTTIVGSGAAGATAPDGTPTAITVTSNGGAEIGWRANFTYATTTTYTASCYVKYGTARYAYMRGLAIAGGTAADGAWFDLQNGVVATKGSGWTSTSITAVGTSGWYRIVGTFTTSGTISNNLFDLRLGDTDAAITSTTGQTGVIWGVQIEVGAFPTSYIQTFASTVTRAADQITLVTSAYPKNWPCTFFCEVGTLTDTVDGGILSEFSTGQIDMARNSGGQLNGFSNGASSFSSTLGSPTLTANATHKAAARYDANDSRLCLNGTLGTQDVTVTAPNTARTDLYIGRNIGDGTYLNGYFRKIMVLPRAMTNAELQTLTT